jgi:(p)ppGpp synthase/HD superfamily hydrolase
MQIKQLLQRAIQIAAEAHEGQQDKVGNPYFDHCRRVADLVVGDEERIIAFLHDVPEKGSGWTLDRLKQEGFSPSVIAAVDALTKRVGEADHEFVRRAASNRLARAVKQADLEDNLVQAKQAGLDTSKYLHGLEILQNM